MKLPCFTLILLFFLTNVFAQDTPQFQNVLVITSTKQNNWGPPSMPKVFKTGKRVYVENKKDSSHKIGKIQSISDSSITVKGIEFKLNDIARINRYSRGIPAIVGAPVLIGGIVSMVYISEYFNNQPTSYNGNEGQSDLGPKAIAAVIIAAGMATTITGLMKLATAKHYYMNGSWKMEIRQDIMPTMRPSSPFPFPRSNKKNTQ